MGSESIVFSIFLIFSGAAVISSFALFTRQPLIVGYIVLGGLFGPYGLDLVSDSKTLEQISLLRSLGFDYAQGFAFSRPVAATDAAQLLSTAA